MNFNNLASTVATSVSPIKEMGARGRAPNPEIEKLVAQGLPYWKARAMVKKGLHNTAPTNTPDSEVIPSDVTGSSQDVDIPISTGSGLSASQQKTQAAIDDYVSSNPHATPEDVMNHLQGLNSGPNTLHTPYIVDPKEISQMMTQAVDTETDVALEPSSKEIDDEKSAKFARLKQFMSLPRAKRDEYLARFKNDDSVPVEVDDTKKKDSVEKDPEDAEGSWVHHYVGQMKPNHDVEDDEESNLPSDID